MSVRKGRHLIVSLGSERLALTVANVSRQGFELVSRSVGPAPADPTELHRTIVEAATAARPRPDAVQILIADRSAPRLTIDLPKLKRAELLTVLERRARQEAHLGIEAPIEVAHLVAGRSTKGLTTYLVAGFPETCLKQVRPILDDPLLHVETVSLREHAALNALPSELPAHAVLLDENRGGVRIAYLTGGALTHERQVMLDIDPAAERARMISSLRFELARTLDYFASKEAPPPEALVFTPTLGLTPEEQGAVARDLPCFDLDLPPAPEGQASVDLPVLGILRALSGTGEFPMLDRGRPARPKGTLVATMVLLAATVGSLYVARAATDYAARQVEALRDFTPRIAALERERAQLEEQLVPDEDIDPERERLKTVLGRRRPASRLLADVLRAIPAGVVLRDVGYDERGHVYVRGDLPGVDRLDAIRKIAALRAALEETQYLRDVAERIDYVTPSGSGPAPLQFELHAEWES